MHREHLPLWKRPLSCASSARAAITLIYSSNLCLNPVRNVTLVKREKIIFFVTFQAASTLYEVLSGGENALFAITLVAGLVNGPCGGVTFSMWSDSQLETRSNQWKKARKLPPHQAQTSGFSALLLQQRQVFWQNTWNGDCGWIIPVKRVYGVYAWRGLLATVFN